MKMKKILALILAIVLMAVLCACGGSNKDMAENVAGDRYYGNEFSPDKDIYESMEDSSGSYSDLELPSVDSSIYDDPDAKVIRTANMTIQTTEFQKAVSALAELTESLNGYYETSKINGGNYNSNYTYRTANFVVRIPKENFVAFRDAVGDVGHIYYFAENADNVGEEYYDIETRLATLETKHERLLALLAEATYMEDIIKLESALADVEYQMDRYNTSLRKYDSLIDYSTFTIELNEVARIVDEPEPTEGFWSKLGAQLSEGFKSFAEGFENFILWFARNIIILVILAAIVFVVVRIIIVKKRKRRARLNQSNNSAQ